MSPEQKQIVRNTWQEVAPQGDMAAQLFYSRLFEIDPSSRPLFQDVDLPKQRTKLLQALSDAVQGLDAPDALVPVLQNLGRRHADYGVTDDHYDSVGAALLWALEQGLGPDWTPEAKDAWAEAYALISGVMRHAGQ